jgi:folate-dependent phosphoribosylglycinamide formyltransferase PurN
MGERVTWIALFSQTGSEIAGLANELGRGPDHAFYNRREFESVKLEKYAQSSHDNIMNWLRRFDSTNAIITLHGYLRIIPEDVCIKHQGRMFNGHPGAIDIFPDLKGKDPQERTWEEIDKYRIIGSVVHEVTPGVDEGRIVSAVHYSNRARSKEELYDMLKKSSLEAWVWFMRRRLCV